LTYEAPVSTTERVAETPRRVMFGWAPRRPMLSFHPDVPRLEFRPENSLILCQCHSMLREFDRTRGRGRTALRPRSSATAQGEESGADGTRTRDLVAASHSLSQLSYGPLGLRQCSRELEILGPMDAEPLVVLRGHKAQINLRSGTKRVERDVVAAVVIR
jgi:hypothetical protein